MATQGAEARMRRAPAVTALARGLAVALAVSATACDYTVGLGGHDAGSGPPTGVSCGPVECGAGQVCCNPSCGLCVAPGFSCVELACGDAATPDAGVEDDGALPLPSDAGPICAPPMDFYLRPGCGTYGWAFDGTSCVAVDGCECMGSECSWLFPSEADCLATCLPPPCVEGDGTCGSGHYCDMPDDSLCGRTRMAAGRCAPSEASTARECDSVYHPVCGCDGATYNNACIAGASGTDVAYVGACRADPCAADELAGEGACMIEVGWAWDPMLGCSSVVGCSCVGADCGRYVSLEECISSHLFCEYFVGPMT